MLFNIVKKNSAIFHSLINFKCPSYGSLLLPPHFLLPFIFGDKPQQNSTCLVIYFQPLFALPLLNLSLWLKL